MESKLVSLASSLEDKWTSAPLQKAGAMLCLWNPHLMVQSERCVNIWHIFFIKQVWSCRFTLLDQTFCFDKWGFPHSRDKLHWESKATRLCGKLASKRNVNHTLCTVGASFKKGKQQERNESGTTISLLFVNFFLSLELI